MTFNRSTNEIIYDPVSIRIGLGPDNGSIVLVQHIEIIPGCHHNLGDGHVSPQTPAEQGFIIQACDPVKGVEFYLKGQE